MSMQFDPLLQGLLIESVSVAARVVKFVNCNQINLDGILNFIPCFVALVHSVKCLN